jgi:F-type H+-transporting ATPase subunit gamma
MELVAATKMRKAEQDARATDPYSDRGRKILRDLLAHTDVRESPSPFLRTNEKGKILALVITPDRGLCGALGTSVLRETNHILSQFSKDDVDVMTIGKRGQDVFRRKGYNIIAAASGLDWKPKIFDIRPFAKIALDGYAEQKYRRVYLIFTDYLSSSTQRPIVRWLFPFSAEESEGLSRRAKKKRAGEIIAEEGSIWKYVYEPSPNVILPIIIRNLVEMEIYQALLDSNASEHSARMLAMHSATENAKDLMGDLSLSYNRMRQEGITRELAEISASAA